MFDEDGIVLIMEPADERNLRRFIFQCQSQCMKEGAYITLWNSYRTRIYGYN